MFKAIEVDAASRQRTGRELMLEADNRQRAIDALLVQLRVAPEAAVVDPSRTLVRVNDQLWTVVRTTSTDEPGVGGSLRRAGAKHKQVR